MIDRKSKREQGGVVMNPIHLRADQISFGYDHKFVVADVNLDVRPGEFVGLIGPNGAGKSTLIKLLSRVLAPQRGRIWLDGHKLDDLKPDEIARRVAVVPQVFDLPAGFTALEIVLMGRTPHLGWLQPESARDLDIARAAMRATGILHLAARAAEQLSGGERQRVVIARALAQEPEVLLLDEPTAHLDVQHQVQVMEIAQRLKQERALAVLGVFHDLNLAAQYCDRIVLLKDGAVYAAGAPASVITGDALRAVYGIEMCVFPHPRNHLPVALIAGR
jgi:iron complex transport system ATP-binding protein